MNVFSTDVKDGVATMTIMIDGESHTFDVFRHGDKALVEHQETLSWRGVVRVSEPEQSVYSALMKSDEMTSFLDEHNISGVQRADNPRGANHHV